MLSVVEKKQASQWGWDGKTLQLKQQKDLSAICQQDISIDRFD